MPVVESRKLSLDEFHFRYKEAKPYFEYWDGEAVQKSNSTRLHSLIQKILVRMLDALGYDSGQEITIKLDPDYEPVPDVIAAEGSIGDPYPTQPFEVAIEILSPEDSFTQVVHKCRLYESGEFGSSWWSIQRTDWSGFVKTGRFVSQIPLPVGARNR